MKDPTAIKDRKDGLDRVRLATEDHVKFANKYSKLKSIIQSEAAKKKVTAEELTALQTTVTSSHDKGFTGEDVDMVSIGQRMASGAGKGASAFHAQMLQMGPMKDVMQKDDRGAEPDEREKKTDDQEDGAEDTW